MAEHVQNHLYIKDLCIFWMVVLFAVCICTVQVKRKMCWASPTSGFRKKSSFKNVWYIASKIYVVYCIATNRCQGILQHAM